MLSVVVGIAGMGDMKKVGRVGLKALLYFELMTTVALAIGLVVVNTLQPGAGMNVDVATLDPTAIANYTKAAKSLNATDYVLHMVPDTVVAVCRLPIASTLRLSAAALVLAAMVNWSPLAGWPEIWNDTPLMT